jgi:hypothetical protein
MGPGRVRAARFIAATRDARLAPFPFETTRNSRSTPIADEGGNGEIDPNEWSGQWCTHPPRGADTQIDCEPRETMACRADLPRQMASADQRRSGPAFSTARKGHDELNGIIRSRPTRHYRSTRLKITPAQGAIDAVEGENDPVVRASTRISMKLWKNGARLKSKTPDRLSTVNGQPLNHLIQYQKGCFQTGVSASSLVRRERELR